MIEYKGRIKKPLSKKINPLWWIKNDDDPPPAGYSALAWFLRNPFHNLFFYVIGVADRNYRVYANVDNCIVRADRHETGWVLSLILTKIPRPFFSYSATAWVIYAGWRPNGSLGFKLAGNT